MNGQHLVEALADGVLLPLLLGGRVEPIPPVGPARAFDLAEMPPAIVGDSAADVERARLIELRKLCPIDAVPSFDGGEWILVCALNDLLQATNPSLPGTFARDRPRRVVGMVETQLERAGAPASLGRALSRHSLFARAAVLTRVDTRVSWWSGSETFHGTEPPARLLSWPRMRRVQEDQSQVQLVDMVIDEPWEDVWLGAVGRWLAASPLTNLAMLGRKRPQFEVTGSLLGVLQSPPGRAIATRVLERSPTFARSAVLLREAADRAAAVSSKAAQRVRHFADEVEQHIRFASERSA